MKPRDIKAEEAQRVARKASAIYECPHHPGVLLSRGKWSCAASGAEEIGVALFKERKLRGGFRSVEEVIKEIRWVTEYTPEECPECASR